jgi:hypothetical protein
MSLNGNFIGDLGLVWPSFSDAPTVLLPDDLGDRIANSAFNLNFLLKALPQLLDDLKSTLSNANGTHKVPIIGDALDAGANIVDQLKTNIVQPAIDGIESHLSQVDTPAHIRRQRADISRDPCRAFVVGEAVDGRQRRQHGRQARHRPRAHVQGRLAQRRPVRLLHEHEHLR